MSDQLQMIKEVEGLIIKNELIAAANKLHKIANDIDDEDLINESLLILSRLNNFLRRRNQGTTNDFDPEFNKISVSIITLKSSLKKMISAKNGTTKVKKELVIESSPNIIVFEESFEDNQNEWALGEIEDSYITSLKHGRYYIDRLDCTSGHIFYQKLDVDGSKNFKILASLTFLKGDSKKSFGITWGGADGNNLFKFVIIPDGKYIVAYEIERERVDISKWTTNSVIKKGRNTNKLEIIKANDIIHYKINDEVVFTSDFISFFGGKFGFIVDSKIKIAIDYFRIIN